jgi:putative sterol carrier protein
VVTAMCVINKLQVIVDAANASEAVRAMMRDWDRVVGLLLDQTNAKICITGGQASVDQYNSREDIVFALQERTLDRLMGREITPLMAKMQGLIHSSGNIIDILRFAAILTASLKTCEPRGPLGRV